LEQILFIFFTITPHLGKDRGKCNCKGHPRSTTLI
jgi:hypothetical protein